MTYLFLIKTQGEKGVQCQHLLVVLAVAILEFHLLFSCDNIGVSGMPPYEQLLLINIHSQV